ncbi:AAA family ATPase [Gemella morbillorum]|uniref:ATP-dependent nuclease n=2 Tax=Gemella morbillorum TaxID=29391 RepID=UPI0028D39A4C|nr:AAA family ATPase [Gemella morbillorum]
MKLEKLKEFNERVKKIYEKICLDNHQTINQELYSRFTSEIDNLSDINPSSLNIAEQILEREGYIGDKILNSEYNNEDINYFEKLLKYILDEFKRLEYLNILGEHNTVVIGGNGSGKSALVSFFKESNLNKIIVIPAQKILYCNNTNSRVTIETIQQNQKENLNIKEFIYEYEVNEIIQKISELLNNHIKAAIDEEIKSALELKNNSIKTKTILDKFCVIWSKIFPEIKFNIDNTYMALKPEKNGHEYSVNSMSDGEKVVLLYILVTLYSPRDSYIIVDEPETFLNPSIYKRLWNLLEEERVDCRFIYVSHNVDFITSRSVQHFYWCQSYDGNHTWDIKKIESNLDEFPKSLIVELLGSSKKILFCEGDKNSLDYKVYTALFENEVVVIPVGGHKNVINYTKAYNKSNFFGYSAFGIIDKDYHTEEVLKKYKEENIYHLKFNEIEMFLLTEEIIDNVLNANNTKEDAEKLKEKFKKEFMNIVGERRDNLINRYVKYQIDQCMGQLDDYKFSGDYSTDKIKLHYNNIIDDLNLEDLINELNNKLDDILENSDYNKYLEISNFKYLFEHNARKIFELNYKHISCNKIEMDSELRKQLREKYFLELTNKLLEKNN